MRTLTKAFIGLCFLATAALYADNAPVLSVKDITQKVQAAQDAVSDTQMRIEMDMKDTLSGQEKHYRGQLLLKNPGLVYIHYEKPDEQFLYVNGGVMQMYLPDQKTVYKQENGEGKDRSPFYVGVGRALKKYVKVSRVSVIKDNNDEVQLLFIPLDANQGFDRMKVSIHKKDWWPYEMEMETPSVITKARFKDIKFDQKLKDEQFKFVKPKDAQVVEGAAF